MKEAKITIRQRQGRINRSAQKVVATVERPKLHVFRSNKNIYAQVIDHTGRVLAAASDLKLTVKPKLASATEVGTLIAKSALAKEVTKVNFDRRGHKYHGRIKAVAEAARAGGLQF